MPTKRLTKKAPVSKKPPQFKVVLQYKAGPKTYEFMDEPSAVLFACRYSRDMELKATVFDPYDNKVVTFNKREYDVMKHQEVVFAYRKTSLSRGYSDPLQQQVNSAAATKKQVSNPAPKKKVLKKR